jgi:hypothetical protein
VFVGALRHPENAVNYSRVIALLEDTLLSVLQQSHWRFQVVIACNEVPQLSLNDPRLHFVLVPRPPDLVQKTDVPHLRLQSRRKDKAAKYVEGLLFAAQFQPSYAMIIDLDDYLHKDLALLLSQKEDAHHGWYLESGYIWDQERAVCERVDSRFHQRCGTSTILYFNSLFEEYEGETYLEVVNRPEMQPPQDTLDRLIDGKNVRIDLSKTSLSGLALGEEAYRQLDENFLLYVLSGHKRSVQYFQLKPLQIYGAVYNKATGENCGGDYQTTQKYSDYISWLDYLPKIPEPR